MSAPRGGRTGATRSVRTEATKQKLFDAALRLVGERGAAGVTVDEIAAEAGVAKGTVYYNFGSKDALVEALLRHGVDLLSERLRRASVLEDPSEALEATVDEALGFFAEYPSFAQLLVSEMWRTPGAWRETLELLRDDIALILRGVLDRLAESRRLPEGVRPATAAAALFGTLLVVSLDWHVFHPERTKEDVRESVVVLIRGVAGRRDC
ncbi:transcriptional regulator, TetR family [Streptoalloteichus tenebrarius]|uniref:Transcriptional regulator, TetR family n=1 Tax=Streptoalloteichus tenebrarius (strain ATCC 17920 / DSM 40477 / JCM 4838 / CBS 697.72 / NBRC 16177 / NCIMB 11028 / NRRL B-12390 / A12253. 1 / ISP 5477) TaxID=1933 RepID=A0ABT1I057_STRSD|nr:TetR/AcrR family transcriptional regulator [Streptoalloteichus tenebrarius]MCP2261131.1 transcriptional regulator, TetR family [Streptoalloteichus tenebrarius]BFF03960.1 TetR/AcrR family transcriptional regulator [Streptoalloteichus tenebrarius]